MNVYIFDNIIGNYCHGDYYFVAESWGKAVQMAKKFSKAHNERVNNNDNYTIEFAEEAQEVAILPGFLPLNRTTILVEK